jgi:hypothetical protein
MANEFIGNARARGESTNRKKKEYSNKLLARKPILETGTHLKIKGE